jgi:transposase
MRFYTKQHKAYCGIDLHARSMYVCILRQDGEILRHRHMKTSPAIFLQAMAAYREDLVVCVECIFTWYWLADLCAREGIPFVLGHALYMKAIHGGKAKNDKIDAQKWRCSCAVAWSPKPMSIPLPCAPRGTCSDAGYISRGNARS